MMKKARLVLSLLFISTLLGGCTGFKGSTPVFKNGDLIYPVSDDPYRLRDINFEGMESLINSKAEYIVLFSQKGCSSCEEFKPVIEKYVKNTNQVIYQYEVTSQDFVGEFLPKYKDKFFPTGEIYTPSLFLGSERSNVEQLPNNMFKTTLMLTNMMKEHVYETEVYTFSRITPFKNYVKNVAEFDAYLYDRNIEEHVSAFNLFVHDDIVKSSRKSAILDLAFMSNEDIALIKDYFKTEDLSKLYKYEIKDQNISSGQLIDSPVTELY